jgi:hypothetical protein
VIEHRIEDVLDRRCSSLVVGAHGGVLETFDKVAMLLQMCLRHALDAAPFPCVDAGDDIAETGFLARVMSAELPG